MSAETAKRVLVIEDGEIKWREVQRTLTSALGPDVTITRAPTIESANKEVARLGWSLVVLDISMDIKSSTAGRGAGGHDTTGGLKIAERMFYLGYDAPIVIVTAFDVFPAGSGRRGAALGLQDVVEEAQSLLGGLLIGWVRYGDEGWQQKLSEYSTRIVHAE